MITETEQRSAAAEISASDGSLPMRGLLPEAFPPEAIYGNLVLFSVLAGIALAGWKDSGAVMPDFGAFAPKSHGCGLRTLHNITHLRLACIREHGRA